ncbi:MAG: type II toxin-antitoxin system Phd/YefM family antitoxin [Terriglobales bacterium]
MRQVKTATVSDLRFSFSKIERMLRAGQEIQITKRGRVIARLVPESASTGLPDFHARLRKIFGDTKLKVTGAELIAEMRNDR